MTLLLLLGLPARMGGSLHYVDASLTFTNVESASLTLTQTETAALTFTNVLDDSLEFD